MVIKNRNLLWKSESWIWIMNFACFIQISIFKSQIIMRRVGYLLIAIGLALLVFLGYSYWRQRSRFITPIPEDKGVKVIFITPGS